MNLVYGEIVAISAEGEMRVGKIRIGGAIKKAFLDLVTAAEIGDSILLCDGVAIAMVEKKRETEKNYVSGDSGKAH
jgi:hydrogenase maturation factor